MAYAEGTTVPVEKSIAEIVALAKKHGATRIGQFEEPSRILVQFEMSERLVRFSVPQYTADDMPGKRGARPANQDDRVAAAARRNRQRAWRYAVTEECGPARPCTHR